MVRSQMRVTASRISSELNCSSMSLSRSVPEFIFSPSEEGPEQPTRSINCELEGVDTSNCILAEIDSRPSELSRSIEEEGSSIKALCENEKCLGLPEAAFSSMTRREEDSSRSDGDGRDCQGHKKLCKRKGLEGSDDRDRSTRGEYSGLFQEVGRVLDNSEQFLGLGCAEKNCMNSNGIAEGCSETAHVEKILIRHRSCGCSAVQGGSLEYPDVKGCKMVKVVNGIETYYGIALEGSVLYSKRDLACNSGNDDVSQPQPYLPGLDNESALRCLAFVPLFDVGRLSRVGRQYRDLVRSRLILKLRRDYGMIEHLVFIYTSGPGGWTVYDANRNVWRSLPPANVDPAFDLQDRESLSAGAHVLWLGKVMFEFVYYRYDLLTNRWERGPSMINPRCLFASASCGDFAYVAGGFGPADNSGALSLLNSAERYNSLTGQWERLPPMSTPRHKCSGFFMDGKFYVIGGRDANHQPIMSGEEYNPTTGVWRTIPKMYFGPEIDRKDMFEPSPPLVAVVNNQLYAVENTANILKIYNKQSNTWCNLGDLPVPVDLRNGWGVAFKALGDGLFVMGDLEGIAAFYWRPGPNVTGPGWQLLSHRERGVNSFLYNCAVMNC